MLLSDCSSFAAAWRCAVGSSSPSRRLAPPGTGKGAVDAGFDAVAAGITVTFGNPRRIRHILPHHEFRGSGGWGSGVYTARYCYLHRPSVPSRADPVTGKL